MSSLFVFVIYVYILEFYYNYYVHCNWEYVFLPRQKSDEIWGSHGSDCKEYCLTGCEATWFGLNITKILKEIMQDIGNILPDSTA
jgi:hypothetical protein